MSTLSPAEKRARGIELAVFLCLIVPPTVLQWFLGSELEASLALHLVAAVLGESGLVALVLYLNWRSGEPVARLGWKIEGAGREATLGVLLFVPFVAVGSLLGSLLQTAGVPGSGASAPAPLHGAFEIALAGLMVVTIAIAEETIFRGYLLLRIDEFCDSKLAAVLGSSAIFALGHQYQGASGMITVGLMGVMLAGVYLWRKSLVAVVVIHLMQDSMAVFIGATAGR